MFKDTELGQTHSYPIITIKPTTDGGWYIKTEIDSQTSGAMFITDAEIRELQFQLNKILK